MVRPRKPLGGYIRVSRKGDREELRSPGFQRSAIKRYARAEGFKVELAEPEIDVSGSKPRRAILDALIARVKAGELGGIVVAKLDRLSRLSPKDRVLLFEEVEGAGGVILSAGEQLDPSTPEGRFAREVFLGVARMQWEKYREGFEEAKRAAVEQGIPINTRAAVGLVKDEDSRRLLHDPEVAPIVREAFELRASGAGPTEVAEHLERAGVRTSQGSTTWSKQAVYGLLRNPIYKGELRYGRDDRYVNTEAVEPIVDAATWAAAQHPSRRLAHTSERSAWLLAGILRCHACGYCTQGTLTSRGKRIYRCTVRHAGGRCPAPARIAADEAERAAVDAFWAITANVQAEGGRDEAGYAAAELEAALDAAERRLRQLEDPDAQDALGERYLHVYRQRRDERDRAAEALGRARAKRTAEPVGVETLRGAWERMATRERRDLLGLRLDAIALRREPRELVVYPAGTGPTDLPRRGYKRSPELSPFPEATVGALAVA